MGGPEAFAEVRLNAVVVEQRIVDVEEKDGVDRGAHGDVQSVGVCKKPGQPTVGGCLARASNRA
jgi:hypothetical protein